MTSVSERIKTGIRNRQKTRDKRLNISYFLDKQKKKVKLIRMIKPCEVQIVDCMKFTVLNDYSKHNIRSMLKTSREFYGESGSASRNAKKPTLHRIPSYARKRHLFLDNYAVSNNFSSCCPHRGHRGEARHKKLRRRKKAGVFVNISRWNETCKGIKETMENRSDVSEDDDVIMESYHVRKPDVVDRDVIVIEEDDPDDDVIMIEDDVIIIEDDDMTDNIDEEDDTIKVLYEKSKTSPTNNLITAEETQYIDLISDDETESVELIITDVRTVECSSDESEYEDEQMFRNKKNGVLNDSITEKSNIKETPVNTVNNEGENEMIEFIESKVVSSKQSKVETNKTVFKHKKLDLRPRILRKVEDDMCTNNMNEVDGEYVEEISDLDDMKEEEEDKVNSLIEADTGITVSTNEKKEVEDEYDSEYGEDCKSEMKGISSLKVEEVNNTDICKNGNEYEVVSDFEEDEKVVMKADLPRKVEVDDKSKEEEEKGALNNDLLADEKRKREYRKKTMIHRNICTILLHHECNEESLKKVRNELRKYINLYEAPLDEWALEQIENFRHNIEAWNTLEITEEVVDLSKFSRSSVDYVNTNVERLCEGPSASGCQCTPC